MTVAAITTVPNRPIGTQPRAIADILGDFDHITNYINNSIVPVLNAGRAENTDTFQQGVISGSAPTRDSATQVTIPAGVGYITQVDGTRQRVSWSSTTIGTIPVGPANGRVDQFVVDSNGAVTRLVGANAGAAIVNLDDANATASRAAVPTGSMRLFEAVVDATGVVNTAGTKYRDRRTWAKGANSVVALSADKTTASAAFVDIDATWAQRVECLQTNPYIIFSGDMDHSAGPASVTFGLSIDGGTEIEKRVRLSSTASESRVFIWRPTVSVGSHLFKLRWLTSGGATLTLRGSGAPAIAPPYMRVLEDLNGNSNNGAA